MKPNYLRTVMLLGVLVFVVSLWAYFEAVRSPLDKAILECAVCNMDREWVETTIEDI